MLRRAENVTAVWRRGLIWLVTGAGRVTVHIGNGSYLRPGLCRRKGFARMVERSDTTPVLFISVGERNYWLFDNRWFWENENLSQEDVHALLVTRDQRRQASIDRAKSLVAMELAPSPAARGMIGEDIKLLVWKRDGGRCRYCGSNSELQYDHIIPASLGGASSPENLQILCGPCNRRKGASVSSPNATLRHSDRG